MSHNFDESILQEIGMLRGIMGNLEYWERCGARYVPVGMAHALNLMEARYGVSSVFERGMEWWSLMYLMSEGMVLNIFGETVSLDVIVPGSRVVWGRLTFVDVVKLYSERAEGRPKAL